MPIVDLQGVPFDGSDLLWSILSRQSVIAANEAFLSKSPLHPATPIKSLCVLQGEQALYNFGEQDCLIGSTDATTCCIAVVICSKTNNAWASHYDDGLCWSDVTFLETANCFLDPHLYLVGCFEESTGISLKVCTALLDLFHHHIPKPFKLQLACLAHANTDAATGQPRSRDLVVQCSTGVAYVGAFADRGPEVPRRMAFPHCSRVAQLLPIYDTENDRLILPAFDAKLPSWYIMRLERFVGMQDEELLERCSTSPRHESDYFVADMRAAYQWLIDAQEKEDVQEARYSWSNGANKWLPVETNSQGL